MILCARSMSRSSEQSEKRRLRNEDMRKVCLLYCQNNNILWSPNMADTFLSRSRGILLNSIFKSHFALAHSTIAKKNLPRSFFTELTPASVQTDPQVWHYGWRHVTFGLHKILLVIKKCFALVFSLSRPFIRDFREECSLGFALLSFLQVRTSLAHTL